jgi:tetratricopeptide (TPR) repeat protein
MEALDAQRRAVALNPTNAWLRFSLANQLGQIGRLDEAAAEFSQAIELDPRNLRFRIQMANFYSLRQQPMLARPHLEAAVAIEPNSAEAHGWLGQIYLQLNQLTEARREMDSALALSPQDFRLLVNAGMLNLQMNRPDIAEEYFKRGAQLNPTAPQPYLGLCYLYWLSNRTSEFNAAFQALMGVNPSMAQQLQLQLQAMQLQYVGQPYNQQAALQAQWLAWLQGQAQAAPTQPWSPVQATPHHPPSPRGA